MSVRRHALLVLALVAVVAAAASSLAQAPTTQSEEAFNGAPCYSCHRVWTPVPMRTMFVLQPPTQDLQVGGVGEYGVGLQQAWIAVPPWPKLTHFEAFIDLQGAASLGFASQQPPLLGLQTGGVIAPASSPLGDASAYVTIDIPPGTSDLVLTVASNSTDTSLGPDLVMKIHPGKERPGTVPYTSINERGRGEPERFVIHGGRNITALSPEISKWAIDVWLAPTTSEPREVQVEPRPIPFTVTMDAYRNLTGETRQFTVVDRVVEAGQNTILPFNLRALEAPAAGERVQITVNATAYYPHKAGGGNDDWGNFSKTTFVDVTAGPDGAVTLGQATPGTVVATPTAVVPLDRVSEAIGYLSAFLIVSSIVSGGMFGKASRRGLNKLFGVAKRRVAFHNALSYFLTVAAVVHTILFLVEQNYLWTLGILWGGLAILSMFGLGVTGAIQVMLVRRWGYGVWRWTHFGLAVAAIVFTVVHMLLDGANFGAFQDAVGWEDPFPDDRQVRA